MSTTAKALELLDYFNRAQPQHGLSGLARLAGLNKATCFRLASDLCAAGLLEQVDPSREYRLGPGVLRLAALREAHVPTREAALPVLQGLADATGETAHLSLLITGRLRAVAAAYSVRHATRVMLEDTEILPFHATSSGLAVLAFQADGFRQDVLRGPLPAFTPATATRPEAVETRLAQVRSSGYAESRSGFELDVHSMAVPLFDASGRCTGAAAVAAPAARMTDDLRARVRAELGRTGQAITTIWGGLTPGAVVAAWRSAA